MALEKEARTNKAGADLDKRNKNWQKIDTHLAEKATLANEGHVKLSSALTSTSETLGATPKAINDLLNKLNLLGSGKVKVKVTDGGGQLLCPNPSAAYLLWAQNLGGIGSYILATGIRHPGAYPDGAPRWTVINSAGLSLGAANASGTQTISGATASTIRCYCIEMPN